MKVPDPVKFYNAVKTARRTQDLEKAVLNKIGYDYKKFFDLWNKDTSIRLDASLEEVEKYCTKFTKLGRILNEF